MICFGFEWWKLLRGIFIFIEEIAVGNSEIKCIWQLLIHLFKLLNII